jgi:hypothetical protein
MPIAVYQKSLTYYLSLFFFALISLPGLGVAMSPSQSKDIDLKVGIIQRFGDENKDQLNLKEPKGEILTIRFLNEQGQRQTMESKQAQLAIAASEQATIWERQELEKAEKVRIKALQVIAPKANAMWAEIDTLLVAPKAQNYDQALKLLIQLRDLANYQNQTVIFQERVQRIAKKYPNRTGLLDRLRKAELC